MIHMYYVIFRIYTFISEESCNRSALLYITCHQDDDDCDNVTVLGVNTAFFETVSIDIRDKYAAIKFAVQLRVIQQSK